MDEQIKVKVAEKDQKTLKRTVFYGQEDDLDSCNPRDWSDDTLLITINDDFNSLDSKMHNRDVHYYDEAIALKAVKASNWKYFQLLKYRDYGSGGITIDETIKVLPIEKLNSVEDKMFNMIMLGKEEDDIFMAVNDLQKWVSGQVYYVYAVESKKCESCGQWEQDTVDSVGGIYLHGSDPDFLTDLWNSAKDAFNVADQWDLDFKGSE